MLILRKKMSSQHNIYENDAQNDDLDWTYTFFVLCNLLQLMDAYDKLMKIFQKMLEWSLGNSIWMGGLKRSLLRHFRKTYRQKQY